MAMQHAQLSFGLVNMPVGVITAVSDKADPSFRILHAECSSPIKKVLTSGQSIQEPVTGDGQAIDWCKTCGKEAVEKILGYEYAKGRFALFTQDEVAALKGGRNPTIVIRKFVKRAEVGGLIMHKLHWLAPQPANDPAYGLLYQQLATSKLAAIGSQQIWGKEHPVAIIANQERTGGVLAMLSLVPVEDLVFPDFSAPIPTDRAQKALAKQIIDGMTTEFNPETDLVSHARLRMQETIARRIEGAEVAIDTREEVVPTPDLADALRDTVAAIQAARKPARKPAAKKSPVAVRKATQKK